MIHLSEEQLVQQYYGEPDDLAERRAHLDKCEMCRSEFIRLSQVLDSVTDFEPPARSEQYGTEVWNRIRAHLPEPKKKRLFLWHPARRWAAVGALAAVVIAAFFLGRATKPGEMPGSVASDNAQQEKKALLVALDDHLDRSQMVLIELARAPKSDEVDITSERQRAGELLAANRLYRQAAIRGGDADIAAVLDELERVLTEVTHEPSKLDSSEMQSIQQRIESKGILFKVRVIGSKVRQNQRRPEKQDAPAQETTRQTT